MKMLKSDFTSAVQGTSVQQTLHPSMRVRALLQQTFTALSTLATVRLSLVMVMNDVAMSRGVTGVLPDTAMPSPCDEELYEVMHSAVITCKT